MNLTRLSKGPRIVIATLALAAVGLVPPAATPVDAAGLRHCKDVTGHAAPRVACYELVWVDGAQHRMTFFAGGTAFPGNTPADRLTPFYILAAQSDTPQYVGLPFTHDHVVGSAPRQNGGQYRVHLHGYFTLCSAAGITSGACVPVMTEIQGIGALPFAQTVDGQALTSAERIESASDAGLLMLIDTGGTVVGTFGG